VKEEKYDVAYRDGTFLLLSREDGDRQPKDSP
jgi:hypothetical protein